MTTRSLVTWATIALVAGSLTGCAGSGADTNFRNVGTTPRVAAPTAVPTASTPTNSGWARPTSTTTQPQGDASAIAPPMGNSPQFTNQPATSITPAGGLAPPVALPGAVSAPISLVPAAPAPGPSTSNLIPTGSSINSLNGGTPVGAAPAPGRQVAVNAVRTADGSPRVNVPVPAAPPEDPANGPAMPPASVGMEQLQPQQPPTHLSPVTLVAPPPTTVRQ